MEKLSEDDKRILYRGLAFFLGCFGMYLFLDSQTDQCGSPRNAFCSGGMFEVIEFFGLLAMIIIGLFGWLRALFGVLIIAGFLLYQTIK